MQDNNNCFFLSRSSRKKFYSSHTSLRFFGKFFFHAHQRIKKSNMKASCEWCINQFNYEIITNHYNIRKYNQSANNMNKNTSISFITVRIIMSLHRLIHDKWKLWSKNMSLHRFICTSISLTCSFFMKIDTRQKCTEIEGNWHKRPGPWQQTNIYTTSTTQLGRICMGRFANGVNAAWEWSWTELNQ